MDVAVSSTTRNRPINFKVAPSSKVKAPLSNPFGVPTKAPPSETLVTFDICMFHEIKFKKPPPKGADISLYHGIWKDLCSSKGVYESKVRSHIEKLKSFFEDKEDKDTIDTLFKQIYYNGNRRIVISDKYKKKLSKLTEEPQKEGCNYRRITSLEHKTPGDIRSYSYNGQMRDPTRPGELQKHLNETDSEAMIPVDPDALKALIEKENNSDLVQDTETLTKIIHLLVSVHIINSTGIVEENNINKILTLEKPLTIQLDDQKWKKMIKFIHKLASPKSDTQDQLRYKVQPAVFHKWVKISKTDDYTLIHKVYVQDQHQGTLFCLQIVHLDKDEIENYNYPQNVQKTVSDIVENVIKNEKSTEDHPFKDILDKVLSKIEKKCREDEKNQEQTPMTYYPRVSKEEYINQLSEEFLNSVEKRQKTPWYSDPSMSRKPKKFNTDFCCGDESAHSSEKVESKTEFLKRKNQTWRTLALDYYTIITFHEKERNSDYQGLVKYLHESSDSIKKVIFKKWGNLLSDKDKMYICMPGSFQNPIGCSELLSPKKSGMSIASSLLHDGQLLNMQSFPHHKTRENTVLEYAKLRERLDSAHKNTHLPSSQNSICIIGNCGSFQEMTAPHLPFYRLHGAEKDFERWPNQSDIEQYQQSLINYKEQHSDHNLDCRRKPENKKETPSPSQDLPKQINNPSNFEVSDAENFDFDQSREMTTRSSSNFDKKGEKLKSEKNDHLHCYHSTGPVNPTKDNPVLDSKTLKILNIELIDKTTSQSSNEKWIMTIMGTNEEDVKFPLSFGFYHCDEDTLKKSNLCLFQSGNMAHRALLSTVDGKNSWVGNQGHIDHDRSCCSKRDNIARFWFINERTKNKDPLQSSTDGKNLSLPFKVGITSKDFIPKKLHSESDSRPPYRTVRGSRFTTFDSNQPRSSKKKTDAPKNN